MADLNCSEVVKALPDYQAGLLEGARRSAVEAHLAACPSCRGELAALERAAALLDETEALKPSRDLWPAIAAQLSLRRTSSAWWRIPVPRQPAWRFALAAAFVLFVALSVLIGPLSGPPEARLATQPDEDAPVYARWHAEASLTSGMADPYALAFIVSRQTARLEEATAP